MTPDEPATTDVLDDLGYVPPEDGAEPLEGDEPLEGLEAPQEPVQAPEINEAEIAAQYFKKNPQALEMIVRAATPAQTQTQQYEPPQVEKEPDWNDEKYDNSPTGAAEFTRDHNAWQLRQMDSRLARLDAMAHQSEVTTYTDQLAAHFDVPDDGKVYIRNHFVKNGIQVGSLSEADAELVAYAAKGYALEKGATKPQATRSRAPSATPDAGVPGAGSMLSATDREIFNSMKRAFGHLSDKELMQMVRNNSNV